MVLTPSNSDDLAGRPTVALPRRPPALRRPGRAPLAVVAAANAVWAALASFVPVVATVVLVTLVGASRPPLTSTIRYAAAAWLLAHGVPLLLDGYPFALVPLAITVFAAWRVIIAGRSTARATRASATLVGVAVGIGYGALGALTAAFADRPGLAASVPRAGLTLAVFGGLAAFAGASAGGGRARRWWLRIPPLVRAGVRAGAVATFFVLAAGALAAGMAIAFAGSTATTIVHNYHAGVAGQAGIVVICLVYAPNVAVWAAAYLAGPSFTLGGVPQLPVFAGLPSHPVTGAGQLLLATPVVAGCVAGVLLARRWDAGRSGRERSGAGRSAGERSRGEGTGAGRSAVDVRRRRVQLVAAATLGGPVAGVALAIAGWAAAGPLGSKLLANTGDVGWQFPIVCGIGIAFGACIGAGVVAFAPSHERVTR